MRRCAMRQPRRLFLMAAASLAAWSCASGTSDTGDEPDAAALGTGGAMAPGAGGMVAGTGGAMMPGSGGRAAGTGGRAPDGGMPMATGGRAAPDGGVADAGPARDAGGSYN